MWAVFFFIQTYFFYFSCAKVEKEYKKKKKWRDHFFHFTFFRHYGAS